MNRWRVYDRSIRHLLPRRTPLYAGIPAAGTGTRWGDGVMGPLLRNRLAGDLPDYERALIEGLRASVLPGDRVLVIGGGVGVTAAIAAQLAGASGSVHCIEGGAEQIRAVRGTAALNGVAERVTAEHGFVGPSGQIYGSKAGARDIAVADLPGCDVLELDCEGAEAHILAEMTIRPRVILVECHGIYGAPTAAMQMLLERIGYRVENLGIAEPHLKAVCLKNDVFVLRGIRS